MPDYHVGFNGRAGINTANSPIVNLWTPTRKARILEIGIFIQTAPTTAPIFALQRATARGTQSTTSAPMPKDPADIAATAVLDLTWTVNPTFVTTAAIRDFATAGAIGNGIIWNLDELEVAIASGLTIFNVNAAGTTLGAFCGHYWYRE